MKILPLLFTGILLNSFFAAAQPPVTTACTEASLLQTPGKWKEGRKGAVTGITATDLAKEKKLVAALHSMIRLKYSPIAVDADFGGAYDRPFPNMVSNGYYYRIIPLNYYCEGGSLKVAHETPSFFEIAANMFDAEIYDTAQGDRLLAEGFNVMPDLPIAKDGYWYFKETNTNLGFGLTGKKLMILVTYDGKLPYANVSRREFLEKRKKMLSANENNNKPDLARINTQLKMPAAELDQPAIVRKDPKATFDTYIFTDDSDPFGKVLIKPNPGYFNKKLSRSTPQFIWVSLVWNDKEPIASKFREDIMKAVDITTLKNMLGK